MSEASGEGFAMVNYNAGRAVIFEDSHPIAYLELEGSTVRGPLSWPEGRHFGMWLQPIDAVREEAGESPYLELQQRMRSERDLFCLVQFFTSALDPALGDLRESSAERFEVVFRRAHHAAVAKFTELVLGIPLPPQASTRDAPLVGYGAIVLEQVVAKWGHRPITL